MAKSKVPARGLTESMAIKVRLVTGEWPRWYMLMVGDRPPRHVNNEDRRLNAIKESGEPEWRDELWGND